MRRAVLAAAVLAAACGGVDPAPDLEPGTVVGEAHGALVEIDPASPVDSEGLVEEAILAVELGAAYWSAPAGTLTGWRILFRNSAGACGSVPYTYGCTDPATRTITVGRYIGCRSAFLTHEIGHTVIGDREHLDPRWAGAYDVTACE